MLRLVIAALLVLAALPPATALAEEGTLWLHVVDEAGNPLPGACFEVYFDDGGGTRGGFDDTICDADDNVDDGTVVVRREAGAYVLAQSTAPDRFALADDKAVTIVAGEVTEDTVVNRPAGGATAETEVAPTPVPAAADKIDDRFDVGGHSLHLVCQGSGAPTVVLEAGGPGADSSMWAEMQPRLAQIARTCRYDRAFLGQSDPAGEGTRTIDDTVADLHTLLVKAGVACPCVLVGASWGGPIIQLYAGLYPEDVAGLVFVDGVPPGFVERFLELVPDNAPEAAVRERDRLLGTDPIERVDQLASLRLADTAPPPRRGIPASVITHGLPLGFDSSLPVGELEDAWQKAQDQHAEALNARLIPAPTSASDPVREQPEIVFAAITYVVNVVQHPDESGGQIRVSSVGPNQQPLTGACFQIYVDADGDGTYTDADYYNGACDVDDQVIDGIVQFAVTPGRYVLQNTEPPAGYARAPDRPTRVAPAEQARVSIVFQPVAGTPQAEAT
jgi:pimeloyl-ACP methyl ester carboxylesterase